MKRILIIGAVLFSSCKNLTRDRVSIITGVEKSATENMAIYTVDNGIGGNFLASDSLYRVGDTVKFCK